jgi:hypothetical protein
MMGMNLYHIDDDRVYCNREPSAADCAMVSDWFTVDCGNWIQGWYWQTIRDLMLAGF